VLSLSTVVHLQPADQHVVRVSSLSQQLDVFQFAAHALIKSGARVFVDGCCVYSMCAFKDVYFLIQDLFFLIQDLFFNPRYIF
jgi:hypothetical protein